MKAKRFILMLLVMLGSVAGAWAETVSYIDVDGTSKSVDATVITNSSSTLNEGWYVVKEADVQTRCLTCNGAVKLILADGAKLTATGGDGTPAVEQKYPGIKVSGTGTSLTIYGQANQSGILIANGGYCNAGISGENITINGGTVTAKGGRSGAGIGGGKDGNGSNITINGGCVTATGGESGAGIGGGWDGSGNNITIKGGTVNANGGGFSAAIGGGSYGNGSHISITGGVIIANGKSCGIGGGYSYGYGEHITITGGVVIASTEYGDAIGNGEYATGSNNIFVDSSLCLHADNNNPPTTVISHTLETDIAERLTGKEYATIRSHNYAESREEGAAYYTCSECGRIDPVRQHVHSYEWVVIDEHQHKQVCTSEVGTCIARETNVGAHNIHESILCDTENYMCDVCQYVDEAKKAQIEARDYFSLKAVDGDVTLGMTKTGAPDNCLLQVSADGNIWYEPMTVSETTANIVTIPSGETRYFRRGSFTATDKISTDYFDNYWSFTMNGTGTVEADGNIMSLLDLTCQQTMMDINAFTKLFTECVQLDKVTVNSQALMNSGNMNYVFGNNVKTYVIGKDVTSIGNSAFSRNSAVTSVTIPEGVTSIGEKAFELCGGLTSIIIPSTVQSIGSNAFARCQYISEFTLNCPSTCTISSNAFYGASGYKIIVPALTTHSWTSNAMWETYGSHFTEPTFTLHANEDPDNAGNWYTTFYNSHYAYDIPEGVKAYKAMIEVGDAETVVKLTAIEGNVLPKGEAVLLYSDVSGDIAMTIIDNNDSNDDDNQFCGVDAQTAQEDYGTYNYYMLSYGQNQLGFYKMSDSMMLSANKAFIVQSPAAPARAMRMVFADDVDGIESISSDSANSPIGIYSVSGVRLNKLQKGINIVNGKKVIVR